MILASDLRIGNFIYYSYENPECVWEIDLIFFDDLVIGGFFEEDLYPIQLTKEWLDRFGFEKRNNSAWWHKGNFTYWQDQDTWYWRMEAINPDLTRYVHQLQNLYHALTGEEL